MLRAVSDSGLQERKGSKGMKRLSILAGAAFLTVWGLTPVVAQEAPSIPPVIGQSEEIQPELVGECKTIETKFQTQTLFVTATPDFTRIPKTEVSFRQNAAGCAVVTLAAETAIDANSVVVVRLLLNNLPQCEQVRQKNRTFVFWAYNGNEPEVGVRSFTWVCKVNAGTNRVKFQWAVIGAAQFGFRSVTVQYD
jgi:hypothetical protein